MTELPLVICDIQRAGPSTGMPTKTEQADLLQVMFGRNGEAPVPVLAAQSPSDCFDTAIEAIRIAVKYRTPVILLSDGYIANGAEPWPVPDLSAIPPIDPDFATEHQRHRRGRQRRLPAVHARSGDAGPAVGHPRHRRVCSTGSAASRRRRTPAAVSYDPANHDEMVRTRQAKIDGIVRDIPDVRGRRPGRSEARRQRAGARLGLDLRADHRRRPPGPQVRPPVAQAHLRHLNPFPANLGEVLRRYDRVIVPEMNLGQLATMLRAKYLVDVHSYSRVRGLPISLSELAADLEAEIDSIEGVPA